MINLKSKIYVGLSFLIFIIIVIGFSGIYNLRVLSEDSSAIIQDNYHTIDYSFLMLSQLDSINNQFINQSQAEKNDSNSLFKQNISKNLITFENILILQQKNITEVGEDSLVSELTKNFELFRERISKSSQNHSKTYNLEILSTLNVLRNIIHKIYNLNMNSIIYKNSVAKETSSSTITYMIIILSISLLFILFYLYKFPKFIVAPIRELTEKIHAISSKRYDQKIKIKSRDEIGILTESFNNMAERLKEYEEQHLDQLLLEKKRIDSLVGGLNDGVLLLDENQNIIMINYAAQRILSLNSSEVLNKGIKIFSKSSPIMEIVCKSIYSTEINKNIGDYEKMDFFTDEAGQYYNIDTIEIKAEDGFDDKAKIKGLIIILRNVTPFKERDIAKTNLLATVSHELKTPISSINLCLKLLLDIRIGTLNHEQKNLLESISQQNRKLLGVVNNVLDFAQAETGKISLIIENIDPAQIIDLATSALMILFSEKKINLEIDIVNNPPQVKADLEKSVWILVNILSNAIRYSSLNGTIKISLQLEGNFVKFSVIDFGPGISEFDKERIFQKFKKEKEGYFKGTGLGLAIAKEFVDSQGGKIWVDSSLNNGCQFHFTLPIV